ncbi:MAG: hypothetical protein M1835_006898 [Candelina submexicana]|nr:MAG: hypothetical protein M1835_006898 [Candelina submexicana]
MADKLDIDCACLQEVVKLLNLLSHRNRNQHRVSNWWRWFNMLRRSVKKLLRELQSNNEKRSIARLEFMCEILTPKCHLAFSTVVADNQFSALGLVLLSSLARVSKLIDGARPVHAAQYPKTVDGSGVNAGLSAMCGQDFGEVISRDALPVDIRPLAEVGKSAILACKSIANEGIDGQEPRPVDSLATKSHLGDKMASTISPNAIRKKRRRRQGKSGNAIDALFKGLL